MSRRNSAKKIKERKPETRKRIETMIKFRRQEASPEILFNEKFPHIDQQAADLILHGQWRDGTIIYGLDVTYHSWDLVG